MAKKLPPKFGHDWDLHVSKQEKRDRILRIVLVAVLGLVLMGTLYLGTVVMLNREDPTGTEEPLASANLPGEEPAAGEDDPSAPMPADGTPEDSQSEAPVEPGAEGTPPEHSGDPLVAENPGEAPQDSTPPVSPLFANDLVDNDLDYINLGDERNLLQLFAHYASALEEVQTREQLQEIYTLLRDKKSGEALVKVDELEASARIKEGARAMVLTRMLRKEDAGRAFLEADRYAQPAEFHFEYGFYHLAARALPQAYTQFRTGVRKNPRNPAMRFVSAGTAFDLKKWEEVIEHVTAAEKLVEKVPVKIGLLAALSEARTGQPQAAVVRSRKLREAHPDSAEVKLFLARALGAMGELDESLEIYNELKSELPDAALIKLEMTRAYMASDQKEEALEVAAELAAGKAEDVRIQAWYADILAANGKIDEAAAILEKLSDDLKGNEMAVLRSLLALRQEDYEGASAALEPYHTMDANLGMRWAGLKFRTGETGTAVRDVLIAHQLNAAQWRAVGNVAVNCERWDAAAFAYRNAIDAGDQSVATLNNWAWTAMQDPNGFDAEKIIEACQRALTVAPGQPNILETYGQALLKSGKAGRCMELLVENSEVTEKSAELSLLEARCYLALKAKPSAIASLERCLALMKDARQWHLDTSREEIEKLLAELKD